MATTLSQNFSPIIFTTGDVVHVSVGKIDIIVLNSVETALALLNGKGAICSDRTPLYFVGELVGWKHSTPMLNDGPELKAHRRLLEQELGSKNALERLAPVMQAQTRKFLRNILDEPSSDMLYHHIRMWVFLT
jgi:cytochrome P450